MSQGEHHTQTKTISTLVLLLITLHECCTSPLLHYLRYTLSCCNLIDPFIVYSIYLNNTK